MVYNVRNERLDSGDQSWERRRPRYMEMVADYRPHILAVQEASERQRRDVLADNPRLAYSDPGHENQNPVFYDRDRFASLESGIVWISSTPNVPGSMDWDPIEPRTVYWVGLRDTQHNTRIWVFNTHLDYQSPRSREVGMELIYDRLSDIDPDDHVLVVGDFNAHIGNDIFAPLWIDPCDDPATAPPQGPFEEAMLAIDPDSAAYGTWHNWTGDGDAFRIDFIIASRGLRPVDATIDRRQIDGLWPSDHFPLYAVLEYRP